MMTSTIRRRRYGLEKRLNSHCVGNFFFYRFSYVKFKIKHTLNVFEKKKIDLLIVDKVNFKFIIIKIFIIVIQKQKQKRAHTFTSIEKNQTP